MVRGLGDGSIETTLVQDHWSSAILYSAIESSDDFVDTKSPVNSDSVGKTRAICQHTFRCNARPHRKDDIPSLGQISDIQREFVMPDRARQPRQSFRNRTSYTLFIATVVADEYSRSLAFAAGVAISSKHRTESAVESVRCGACSRRPKGSWLEWDLSRSEGRIRLR